MRLNLQQIHEDVLPNIFSFITIWDHAIIEQLNPYFKRHIALYYSRILQFNLDSHRFKSYAPSHSTTLGMVKWISNHLTSVRSITVDIFLNDHELMTLLQNKPNLRKLCISPEIPHTEISPGIFQYLYRSQPKRWPQLECIQMIGCNWNLYQMSESRKLDLIEWLQDNEQNDGDDQNQNRFEIERIPRWMVGDWVCFEDDSMPRGLIHHYKASGHVEYPELEEDADDNRGHILMTHVEYCYHRNGYHPTDYKFRYYIPGWDTNLSGTPTVIVRRPPSLRKDVRDEIEAAAREGPVAVTMKQLYGESWMEREYHFDVIQIAQNTANFGQGILDGWPRNLHVVQHLGMWIKVVFDDAVRG